MPTSTPPSVPPSSARRSPGVVRWVGFGVSAILHVVVLLLYSSIDVRFGRFQPGNEVAVPEGAGGIQVINLEEVGTEATDRPDEPEERATPVPVAPRIADVPSGEEDLAPGTPRVPTPRGRTAAERLQPGTNDGRLWSGFDDDITALTAEQRIENLMAAEIMDLIDAMEVAAAREEAALDWTYTDDEGNRWGVSPGKLHLGKITLPLPFGFGVPPGASQDVMRRYMQDSEIRRAAGQLRIDETLKERARAIRARRDAERQRERAGQDSSVVRRRSGGGGGSGGGSGGGG